jgi:hypothetical protein
MQLPGDTVEHNLHMCLVNVSHPAALEKIYSDNLMFDFLMTLSNL